MARFREFHSRRAAASKNDLVAAFTMMWLRVSECWALLDHSLMLDYHSACFTNGKHLELAFRVFETFVDLQMTRPGHVMHT